MTSLSKPVAKKLGRPVGSKNAAVKDSTFKQSKHQRVLHAIVANNLQLIDINRDINKQIDNLKHQIIGFRAVISYLENRLNLTSSQ